MPGNNQVVIAGVGMTQFKRHFRRDIYELTGEAVLKAVEDAGLELNDIDATFVSAFSMPLMKTVGTPPQYINDHLGLSPKPAIAIENACPSALIGLQLGVQSIIAGVNNVVLVVAGDKMDLPTGEIVWRITKIMSDEDYSMMAGLPAPGAAALYATRYMYEYGATEEQIAHVTVKNRKNAVDNPNAVFRTALTVEQVMASPYIVTPLKLPEINPSVEGAAAVILCRKDLTSGLKKEPVYVKGYGMSTGINNLQDLKSFSSLTGLPEDAEKAFKMAGVGREDIDLVEMFDCMAPLELIGLEDMGFFPRGQAFKATVEGQTRRDGKLPVNSSGGNLGVGGSISSIGLVKIIESVWQLRGEAGKRQVKCRSGLALAEVHGGGCLGNNAVVILSRE